MSYPYDSYTTGLPHNIVLGSPVVTNQYQQFGSQFENNHTHSQSFDSSFEYNAQPQLVQQNHQHQPLQIPQQQDSQQPQRPASNVPSLERSHHTHSGSDVTSNSDHYFSNYNSQQYDTKTTGINMNAYNDNESQNNASYTFITPNQPSQYHFAAPPAQLHPVQYQHGLSQTFGSSSQSQLQQQAQIYPQSQSKSQFAQNEHPQSVNGQHPQQQQQQQHLHPPFTLKPTSGDIPMLKDASFKSQSLTAPVDFSSAPSRTVYLGNIPSDLSPKELLDHVRSGIIENVVILADKNCAFISFLDESSALLFHSDAILKRLNIRDNDIKVGWGRNTPLPSLVLNSIQRDNATRNVYIGNLPKDYTEQNLINDLYEYGTIDTIKILPEKGVAFIHFCSILSAVKVVSNLSFKNEFYKDKKIYYGKDRCAFITKTQQHNAAQYLGLAPGMEHLVTNADRDFISFALLQQSAAAAAVATTAGGANNLGNRTVYLGNLPRDVKIEEICNVVRGGLLQMVKYLEDRHVCFITFIDPIAAAQFYAMCQMHGLAIHGRRIKIGWGKHSGPLSNALTLAVSSGASRNIYIGNIDLNNPKFSQDNLRLKLSEFGEIEQINYLIDKNCVFVNFTNISNAIFAIDKIKIDAAFKDLKINFGKDRCGNTPKQFGNHAEKE